MPWGLTKELNLSRTPIITLSAFVILAIGIRRLVFVRVNLAPSEVVAHGVFSSMLAAAYALLMGVYCCLLLILLIT